MKNFLLIFSLLLLTGCQASVRIDSGPVPTYYESVCNDTGCQLVPRMGVPPADADILGQTQEGLFIYKRHEQPKPFLDIKTPRTELRIAPTEKFPTDEQWKRIIEHNDPSNPNNTIGYAEDGVELRGPIKTVYLETN